MNVSVVTFFYLSDYYGMMELKPLYFCTFLILYITILTENVMLVGVIFLEKSLHEPMYVLLCNLAVNELLGSTALLPALLTNILSHTHQVSVLFCQTQVFAIHTYAMIEFTILAVMSYDRFVAICHPLSYHAMMSERLVKLVVFMWIYPCVAFGFLFMFTVQLPYCGRTIEKLYCVNYLLVKLVCTDTFIMNIFGLLTVVIYAVPQLVMIFYSYGHILKICIQSFSGSKFKALRTCTPHILAVINYSIGCFFELAQGRLDSRHMSYSVKMFMSLYFLVFPPLLNAVIYGLSAKIIRKRFFRLFSRKKRQVEIM
ncbi:olfactory receptor 4K3-like [Nothobranchius furzeri]|uniref:Olfactory receptor n=1 Tax=Nothobranchius furzeri TaxID=105023 RepID=A0A9D3BF57_NOTFU|nr:olfactory receptor 4K3-like [Nothobranchius furzeri]KAF7205899.1 olfactory receptor 4K3-like [Nothobranchius furzeri]